MKLEVLPSSFSYTAEDDKNLKKLLDACGSMVTIKEISTAYCEAGRDTSAAAKLLSKKEGSSFAGSSTSESEGGLGSENDCFFGSSDNHLGENHITNGKEKKCSASMGTVSGVIGKEYVKPRPQSNGSCKNYKPLKLFSDDIPETEIWDEKNVVGSISRNEPMERDIEGFLYEMLGNGFQLDLGLIQDVVGQCGYDMKMSIDKLLDMPAATLGESDDVICIASVSNTEKSDGVESTSFTRSNTDIHTRNELKLSRKEKKKKMQREILESLFSAPSRIEEKQETARPIRPLRPSPYGRVVTKPMQDTIIPDFTFINREPVNNKNKEANEDTYEDLRKGVMEYWSLMKEYYKAAVDAFTNKDFEKAMRFQEEGNFYMRKARQADEKSSQKLIQDSDDEEVITVNVHFLDPKDALSHVKLQMSSYSGFDSVRFLKVVVGTDGGDAKDGKRKRLITRLLEKEGISWTEEGNGWIILIAVDKIDPNELSFVKK